MKFRNLLIIFFLLTGSALFGSRVLGTAGQSKFLGCAFSASQTLNFQSYWNQCTPENGGKWGSVEGWHDVMNWTDLDAAYNYAKKYGILFKEHTLIWGAQQPSWIANMDTASQRREIEQWFKLIAARYPEIDYIDVVNEPLHNVPTYTKALGGTGKTGWDWVITSFRMARKYFPKSKLLINEYNVINSSQATGEYIKLLIHNKQVEKIIRFAA